MSGSAVKNFVKNYWDAGAMALSGFVNYAQFSARGADAPLNAELRLSIYPAFFLISNLSYELSFHGILPKQYSYNQHNAYDDKAKRNY